MAAYGAILGCSGVDIVADRAAPSSAPLSRLQIFGSALLDSMRSLSDNGRANRQIRCVVSWNNALTSGVSGPVTCHYRFTTGDIQFITAARWQYAAAIIDISQVNPAYFSGSPIRRRPFFRPQP